jgi:hypothetical protein
VDAPSHAQLAARVGALRPHVVVEALRTWLRYLVPLTLLSAVAMSPVIASALTTRAPLDAASASATLTRGWLLLAIAWPCQMVLVGGASAVARDRPSQLGALGAGLRQLVSAILPCLAAIAAIAVGSLALAVPGVLLFVLLAPAGASRARGVAAALTESIAVMRKQLVVATLAVLAMLAIDLAIGVAGFRALVGPMGRHPTPAQLAAVRSFVRTTALVLVVVSPFPATVLAMLHRRGQPDARPGETGSRS